LSKQKNDSTEPKAEIRPVADLAIETSNVVKPKGKTEIRVGRELETGPSFTWQHRAAAVLHGWTLHGEGDPLSLTQEDYLAALRAATTTNEKGEYVPHGPALSPYRKAKG
jgi:hypothetical protein